jgi:hypothetical protein
MQSEGSDGSQVWHGRRLGRWRRGHKHGAGLSQRSRAGRLRDGLDGRDALLSAGRYLLHDHIGVSRRPLVSLWVRWVGLVFIVQLNDLSRRCMGTREKVSIQDINTEANRMRLRSSTRPVGPYLWKWRRPPRHPLPDSAWGHSDPVRSLTSRCCNRKDTRSSDEWKLYEEET